MKNVLQIAAKTIEGLIIGAFSLGSSSVLDEKGMNVLNSVLNGLEMARSGLQLISVFDGDGVTEAESKAAQQQFDNAQVRFRATLDSLE